LGPITHMGDHGAKELFVISILAAFCSGLAWTYDPELFAAAFAAAAVVAGVRMHRG